MKKNTYLKIQIMIDTKMIADIKPPRVEYNLTDKGQELVESIINLLQWMRKWSSTK
jgi:DNA-binding HxlR family transcriptional regulator